MKGYFNYPNYFRRMIKVVSVLLLYFITINVNAQKYAAKKLLLKVTNYDLNIQLDYTNSKMNATCIITVKNPTQENILIIPLLLYRLMKISSIKDESGNRLKFSQNVLQFEDWETYQANYTEVKLIRPLMKNDSSRLLIEYDGYLLGFAETGNLYVRDNINTEFTIIRPDCLAYPELGYPNQKVNRAAGFLPSFNYNVTVRVPDSLVVVNGGIFVNKINENGYATYTYKNSKLAWRIDIAISKYKILETPFLQIYYLEKDSEGAKRVFRYAQRTMDLYTKWWGDLKENKTFSVIEIPSGYGSQADVSCILQTADAFNDSTQMNQLYHELSHLWNVSSTDKYDPRWNEGLATFIEYLTIEKLENRPYLDDVTNWFLKRLKSRIENDDKLEKTAMIDFGKEGIPSNSYSVGMIMFQVLYRVMGESDFNKCISSYYYKYYLKGGTTEQFVAIAKQVTNGNLSRFFNDWVFTTKYTEYIKGGITIDEMTKLYQ